MWLGNAVQKLLWKGVYSLSSSDDLFLIDEFWDPESIEAIRSLYEGQFHIFFSERGYGISVFEQRYMEGSE